jgi:hypothetical protein
MATKKKKKKLILKVEPTSIETTSKTEPAPPASGKARGGLARAEALSPERRSIIAKRAAIARWGDNKPLRATHRGNFQEEFGIDVECYVLDDEQKTAVISQGGIAAALGQPANRGTNLVRFLKKEKMAAYVGPELAEKLDTPLVFQSQSATVYGHDVTILIDVCKAVIRASEDGKLAPSQAGLVKQARVIVGASAKAGIKGLVYALAGYDATRAEVIEAFKLFVREEAREYEKEFPDQLYAEWYRLYDIPKPKRNKPWKFMHLTLDQVYVPLARSNGKILALTRNQRASSGGRYKKLHQFLSEIGVKALRTHLGQLLGIAQVSDSKEDYERKVTRVFGRQQSFDFNKRG